MNFKFYSTNVNKHYRIDPSESHHSSAILHFSMINAENLFQFQRELASTSGTSIIFRKERASIEKSDRNSAHGRDYSCFTLCSSVMNKKYAISHPNTGVYALYQSNNGSLGMAEPRLHDLANVHASFVHATRSRDPIRGTGKQILMPSQIGPPKFVIESSFDYV